MSFFLGLMVFIFMSSIVSYANASIRDLYSKSITVVSIFCFCSMLGKMILEIVMEFK